MYPYRRQKSLAQGGKQNTKKKRRHSEGVDVNGISLLERSPSIRGSKKNSTVVVVRVRPINEGEKKTNDWDTTSVVDTSIIVLKDPRMVTDAGDPLLRSRESQFKFDVALGPGCTQEELYRHSAKPIVDKVMAGSHGTVFAYGATGSGKTFSMSGSKSNPGVIPLTIRDLFEAIRAKTSPDLSIKVSGTYLEIYNEELRDLLNSNPDSVISLREDPIRGPIVSGVTEYPMENAKDVQRILDEGARHRVTDSHLLNDASSRSHAILQISVEQMDGDGAMLRGANLSLIDLAGSERAKRTGTSKKMLREGAKINRSLLALANCINALVSQKKGLHIPYRDSKLTRLLKNSLEGTASSVMIATISAASGQFDESRETLLYANRAKNIKITVEAEKRITNHNKQYQKMVYDLKNELRDLKETLSRTMKTNITKADKQENSENSLMVPGKDESPKNLGRNKRANRRPVTTEQSMREIKKTGSLVEKIVANFQDRIQTRRSLMESQDTDTTSKERISQLERNMQRGWLASGKTALEAIEERNALQSGLEENDATRQEQTARLQELEAEGMRLKVLVHSTELRQERAQLLQVTLDKCAIELENTELELEVHYLKKELATQAEEAKETSVQETEIQRLRRLLHKHSIEPDEDPDADLAESTAAYLNTDADKPLRLDLGSPRLSRRAKNLERPVSSPVHKSKAKSKLKQPRRATSPLKRVYSEANVVIDREDFASARERSSLQPPAVLAYAYTDKRRSVMSPRKGVPSPRPAPLNVASPRRYTSTTPRRQGSATTPRRQGAGPTTPRRQGAGPTTPRRQGTGAPSPRPQGTGVPSPRRRGTGAPSPRKGASMGSPPRSRRGRLGQAVAQSPRRLLSARKKSNKKNNTTGTHGRRGKITPRVGDPLDLAGIQGALGLRATSAGGAGGSRRTPQPRVASVLDDTFTASEGEESDAEL